MDTLQDPEDSSGGREALSLQSLMSPGPQPNSDSLETYRKRSRIGSCNGNEALGILRKVKA